MFQFQQIQDELKCLLNNETIISGILVSANLTDHSNLDLNFKESAESTGKDHLGAYTEYRYQFHDKLELLSATLRFRCYDSFIAAFVDSAIKNEELFKRQSFFLPHNAINLTIKNIPEPYEIIANYQHKDWWTRPFFTKNIREVPARTQSLLLKNEQRYYHLLPVCDEVTRTDVKGSEQGLQISISPFHGGYNQLSTFAFVLGTANNPFELVNQNVKAAIKTAGQNIRPREEKQYPEILDYLGWCSWDAFYHAVNEAGILEKADELKEKKLPVKWMMIDDGWSEVSGKKLLSFNADQEKFPNGLANTVSLLKENYGVSWVGVWHTLAGYWEGIAPEGLLAKSLDKHLYKTKNGSLIPSPKAVEGFGFWHAWHSKLKKDGIDFVKVDSQSAISNFMVNNQSVGEAASGAHLALEASCSLHFDNTVINCMGMAAENIWHRPYSAISRNSDDFVPQETNSFKEHALQNAYNSLYHGEFYWGDWDMYWTQNHDDLQNMILRVISGGPIYFSDAVNQTNPDNIWPLIYQDGRIIRCEKPGVPTEDCLFIDPIKTKAPLKIWNTCKGTGVIAAFHLHEKAESVHGFIGPNDVPNLDGERFVIFDVMTRRHWNVNRDEKISIELAENGVSLYLIIPIQEAATPIGLLNKLICQDGVVKVWNNENSIKFIVKEGGDFGWVSESEPRRVTVNGKEVMVLQDPANKQLYTINCSNIQGEVLIEIEQAH